MTNKEAIEVITHFDKHIIPCDEYGYLIDSDLMEAHLMAAHALSSCWIPVTERLPEKEGSYIVTTTTGAVTTARFYTEEEFPPTHYRPYSYRRSAGWSRNRNVTHWMPLPEAPKEVDNA